MNRILFLLLLLTSGAITPQMALASELSHNEILLAQDSKAKKRAKNKSKKKQKPAEESAQENPSADGSTEVPSSDHPSNQGYLYIDALGAAPAFYQVRFAKVIQPRVDIVGGLVSLNQKTSGDSSESTVALSGYYGTAAVAIPVSKMITMAGGIALQSFSTKFSLTSEATGDFSSTSSGSLLGVPAALAAHVNDTVDVGLQLLYNMDSTKSETETVKYNYLTFTPSFGVHGKKFEASFSYQPGVKTKGKVSSTSENSGGTAPTAEKEIASQMSIAGRFLATRTFFVGGGYDSASEKSSKSTSIILEAGMASSALHIAAGLDLKTTTTTSELSDSSTKESENGFKVEATYLGHRKQPLVSALVSYTPISRKSDGSSTTGSTLVLSAGAHLHF